MGYPGRLSFFVLRKNEFIYDHTKRNEISDSYILVSLYAKQKDIRERENRRIYTLLVTSKSFDEFEIFVEPVIKFIMEYFFRLISQKYTINLSEIDDMRVKITTIRYV